MEKITFDFKYPLEYTKDQKELVQIEKLTFRRPMASDLREFNPEALTFGNAVKLLLILIDYESLGLTQEEFEEAFLDADPDDVSCLTLDLFQLIPAPDPKEVKKYSKIKNKKTVTYTLKTPIKYGSETIDEVTIKRPTFKHMMNIEVEASEFDNSAALKLLGPLCGLTTTQAKYLEIKDFHILKVAMRSFLYSGLLMA